jgi:CHAT domain-containing protein
MVLKLLPGAKEGALVESLLTAYGYENISLINKTASEIVLNLFSRDYKVIHLAGHGIYNAKLRQNRNGNYDDIFLTTADIEQMSTVPELVFVNCCHLGKVETDGEKYLRDRYKLAANIGTQLIEIGVKAVIAAGWAVNDQAAADFAKIFYSRMFEGYSFGDAVTEARSFIYENYRGSNNTWGAYQCYGIHFIN